MPNVAACNSRNRGLTSDKHTLIEGLLECVFVADQLSEALDFTLFTLTVSKHAGSRCYILLNGGESASISHISRVSQVVHGLVAVMFLFSLGGEGSNRLTTIELGKQGIASHRVA